MVFANKKVGETPLELLQRIRLEQPELKEETLSYAGRLDPMAEGEMLILVGSENNDREKYLNLDKEYVATFIIGVSTDTGDILGLIKDNDNKIQPTRYNIQKEVKDLINIKEQVYPWFSSKTVEGKPLFEHFKNGNTNITRPSRNIEVKQSELISVNVVSVSDTKDYIFSSIKKVKGDFRQKEILENWTEYFEQYNDDMQVFEAKFRVSSGTYIRGFTEIFSFPATLLKLDRTKIFV